MGVTLDERILRHLTRAVHVGKVGASTHLPLPFDITRQQRLEEMKQLADIFACIFGELSADVRASMLQTVEHKAA